jgi:type 1 glutamine amidotransferase
MRRREMLTAGSAALLGMTTFPFGWSQAADRKRQKILYFTRSVEYEHSVVAPRDGGPSHSGGILIDLGKTNGFEVVCSKDGRIFDKDLDAFDAIVFYSCGNLYKPSVRKTPPMSEAGRERLLEAVASGKAFVGLHSSCYWGRDAGADDAYLEMVGAEFIAHGAQQESAMKVVSPSFPGVENLGTQFRLMDEWYAMKSFAADLHVVLAQETKGMKGDMYQRPPFPATWARMYEKGRVFFTSMGHREDVWTNPVFQQVLLGGLAWALGNVEADISPNIDQVTPHAAKLPA